MVECFGLYHHVLMTTPSHFEMFYSLISKILFVSERLELNGDDQYDVCHNTDTWTIMVISLQSGGLALVTATL
jgi:hypothetical protein